MEILNYPLDSDTILKKRRSIKKQLLNDGRERITKNIAILGGSTTNDIMNTLELFLLDSGIKPNFYQSEYAQYRNDIMFDNPALDEFKPDLILIHTTNRNVTEYTFDLNLTATQVEDSIHRQYTLFEDMWNTAFEKYHCPIVQNNFEKPLYRILGNSDCYDVHGKGYYINRLNQKFYEYAQSHENFHINDIDYLSSDYGLLQWSDTFYWHMYKYAMCLNAIPEYSYNVAKIIKSIYGKNKKALVLDLDNTLWGGVIGDDGQEGIEIGQETSIGQLYTEFQNYLKEQSKVGVLLTVNSKNDYDNAMLGLNHPDGILKPDDFVNIKANWLPKSENIVSIANELNILPESLVFVDDNPAEREIVKQQVQGVAVPDIANPEDYVSRLDRCGYFEVTTLSQDDVKRSEMYKANAQRTAQQSKFADYNEYLNSLEMVATIDDFIPIYLNRITQLTNKSNQFNLTTKRYTLSEMEQVFQSDRYVRLYGKLKDRFGDNGVVSVVIGTVDSQSKNLDIDLWLMSCRVLKRDMEYAMLDTLVKQCKSKGLSTITGYYYKTAKNSMVKSLFGDFGFTLISEDQSGNSIWRLNVKDYTYKNPPIKVLKNEE